MPDQGKVLALLAIFLVAVISSPRLFPAPDHSGSLPGHLLGIMGMALMLPTLIYPYRKYTQGKKGKQNPLAPHIYFGLTGPTLVVLHAGDGYVASLISTLGFLSMLLVILTGIIGASLYQRVNRSLKHQKADLFTLKSFFQNRREELLSCQGYLGIEPPVPEGKTSEGEAGDDADAAYNGSPERCGALLAVAQSISELEYSTEVFTRTRDIFSYWILIHAYASAFLFAVVAAHVLTMLYYGIRWLR